MQTSANAPSANDPIDIEDKVSSTTPHKLEEVEDLTNTLKRLLVQHEGALDEEGVRHELETLERWMESYRRGLSAANKISGTGMEWLVTLRDRLKLAAEERLRLEDEGGSAASKEQTKKAESLLNAARKIDKAIEDFEMMFSQEPCPVKEEKKVAEPQH